MSGNRGLALGDVKAGTLPARMFPACHALETWQADLLLSTREPIAIRHPMNQQINRALTHAAEKVLRRPLSRSEALHLLSGFYRGEGALRDRVLVALADSTSISRSLLECAAADRAGVASIQLEIAQIYEAWLAAAVGGGLVTPAHCDSAN